LGSQKTTRKTTKSSSKRRDGSSKSYQKQVGLQIATKSMLNTDGLISIIYFCIVHDIIKPLNITIDEFEKN